MKENIEDKDELNLITLAKQYSDEDKARENKSKEEAAKHYDAKP